MKKDMEFTVRTEGTLLPFLLDCFSGKSRNYVKGILKRGQITVNGAVCTDYALSLHPGQRVNVLMNAAKSENVLDFPVIYEDDELIVIDKPSGMLSIATDRETENTAYHAVTEYMKNRRPPGRVFIVHRLDRDTSGVMLFAKSERIKLALQDNWEEIVLRRGYIAVVEGRVTDSDGTIKSWLKQTKTLLVYSSAREDGKPAVTNYKTLQASDSCSMLDISLKTGRKNQIRVHMKDIGHPVMGDKKYGARANLLGRLGLHASELIIRHPVSGDQMQFEAAMPRAFTKAF